MGSSLLVPDLVVNARFQTVMLAFKDHAWRNICRTFKVIRSQNSHALIKNTVLSEKILIFAKKISEGVSSCASESLKLARLVFLSRAFHERGAGLKLKNRGEDCPGRYLG